MGKLMHPIKLPNNDGRGAGIGSGVTGGASAAGIAGVACGTGAAGIARSPCVAGIAGVTLIALGSSGAPASHHAEGHNKQGGENQ